MPTLLTISNRNDVENDIQFVRELLAALPTQSAQLLDGIVYQGKSIEVVAAELGWPQAEVAIKLAVTMCAMYEMIGGTKDGKRQLENGLVNDELLAVGNWPDRLAPRLGPEEAKHAAAKHFEETNRRNEAVPLWVQAALGASTVQPCPNAANAYWKSAQEFVRLAEVPATTEADRLTFLLSAERCLQDAAVLAELMRDEKLRAAILSDIARVRLELDDVAMASTYADLAVRSAQACGDDSLQSKVYEPFVAWNLRQARCLIEAERLGPAEAHAKRALNYCLRHRMFKDVGRAYKILDEINELATRPDRQSRQRQLAAHLKKPDHVQSNHDSTIENRCGEKIVDEKNVQADAGDSALQHSERVYRRACERRQNDRTEFERDQI